MQKILDLDNFVSMNFKFLEHIGIRIHIGDHEQPNHASGIIELQDFHSQVYEAAHGGVIYSLADTVAGRCVWNKIDIVKDMVTTIEMKMNYVSACPINGYARADGVIKHMGKRTAVVGVDVFHVTLKDGTNEIEKEKLIGTAIATFQILKDVR